MSAPSELLGALPLLGSIWDHGIVRGTIMAIAAGWGLMNLAAIVFEFRILWPSQQYASFYKGDLQGLPGMIGAGLVMVRGLPEGLHWYNHGVSAHWWHIGWLVFGLLVGMAFMIMEYGRPYTLAEMLSPTKLLHNMVIFPLFIYWMGANMTIIMWQSRLGLHGVFAGDLRGLVPLLFFAVILAYYVKLLWTDINTTPEQAAQKHAHMPIKAYDVLAAEVIAGLFLLLGWYGQLPGHRIIAMMAFGLFLFALLAYGTLFVHDGTTGGRKPWAHAPYQPQYLLGWFHKASRPPWGYDTRHSPSPRELLDLAA